MLYIVSTPIGNLEDISQRALNTLRKCDAILCEDTRRTLILLSSHGIKKKLISYHRFNEAKTLEMILDRLGFGENIALCSDAGTPCINDPGIRLTSACIQKNIPFTAIPGPCSLINALVLSGFETSQFQCIGFLPKKPSGVLKRALLYPGTTLCFESPERLQATLRLIGTLDVNRPLAVVREMTKMFEECKRGTAEELFTCFSEVPPRGEIVLVIGPPSKIHSMPLDIEECVQLLRDLHGLSPREAIRQAAHLLKLPKNAIYKKIHFGYDSHFNQPD